MTNETHYKVTMSQKQYDDYLQYLTTAPNIQRFEQHFDKTDGCWEWKSATNKQGYGVYQVQKDGKWKAARANRVAYIIYNGGLTAKQVVRHTCDNPSCVNPAHLIAGTHKENSKDMCERRRQSRGENRPQHKLTEAQVQEIRHTPNVYGTGKMLAERFGVSRSLISYVRNGGWQHV